MNELEKQTRRFDTSLIVPAMWDGVKKLDPRTMVKQPVMFLVWGGFLLSLVYTMLSDEMRGFHLAVTLILLVTLWFANFAEAIAEGRGKAQAATLRASKNDVMARRIVKDGIEEVASSLLRKGDIVEVRAGDYLPGDGEIIAGLASIDESAITGESAPVIKESGGDFSSVIGGTLVVSDRIEVEITSNPGESFLDQMITLVEGSKRQKTPNEIALSLLLVSLSMIFLLVVLTLPAFTNYLGFQLSPPILIALLVCLIPTTIGGLLSAIGIAGMDRVTRFNVIAMSGKAVEAAGDIRTIILDKTGTITFGNRMAFEVLPVEGITASQALGVAVLTSLEDETPEGRSVLTLAKERWGELDESPKQDAVIIPFKAETRMSGLDLADGRRVRKGAASAVINWVSAQGGMIPSDLQDQVDAISKEGGTPLVISEDARIVGVIHLKDTVKPGMRERFDRLRQMGIKTIMCTGDNPLTAATIAREAGVDEFVAECKPEDKIRVIKAEQKAGHLVAMTGDGTNDAPALAQADVGLAMNSGTQAAKEAANMIDLDSDPTKIIEVVEIGKQLLMTRGALTTFSIANDVAKYFAILPAMFVAFIPEMDWLNVMRLGSPESAILAALLFNALIIPLLIPVAMKGVRYDPVGPEKLLRRNLLVYGVGGVIVPFLGIKALDIVLNLFM
ncbi:potassium-transporting ATPase subunit KdpB [Exiguobacterium profundum]|uniref:potassium-transporting ATPase subunit KdpB n=1 Tax=Exiguobacterium TaxID=33986 RepID=UPI0012F333F9|nr:MULTISPECIES: potassium-transporting ATPase subunit KdpB [Exiguobacterium]QPI68180.1 potassium-transporting ATPase subunit KdpB [Exiguobacterium sp. PBE]MBG0917990.1 potassium-transporting ATPase subunit KdpB [Exiguobacterium sp. SRB7LM]MCT4797358.1 potassium-transporting ATPase subunit KdpB [Exiguobacterium profundum]MCV9900276.1 potassium-transporting ATPase subunit KdpB [Exiguobacterium sp. N5]MDT0192525.1 potassium-transporting ATPase subunit KdpB [Exiguobacterium sp. BG5(2022)]